MIYYIYFFNLNSFRGFLQEDTPEKIIDAITDLMVDTN